MKNILLILILISSQPIFGNGNKRISREYKINSDTKSDTVSKGYCIITGKVTKWIDKEQDEVANGVVSTVDHKYRATTNKQGVYILRIPADKVQLYFFKVYHREIVTSNYDFKSQHIVEIDFFAVYDRPNVTVKKPVIYLYPEKEQDISVQLSPVGEFTFTYPKYDNGWEVTAFPNGDIKDGKGKKYPYLFWEAEQKELDYIKNGDEIPGFIISKEEVISFLEKQLSLIGLNDKEQTDFITYWGPILQKKKYALVQFLIDEEYDNAVGTIKTNPKINSIKRVYVLCTGINALAEAPEVIPQKFVPFQRIGSTLVEWGGSEITISKLTN